MTIAMASSVNYLITQSHKTNLRSTFYFQLLLAGGQSESTSVPGVTTTKGAFIISVHCPTTGMKAIGKSIRKTKTLCSLVSNSFTVKIEEDL